MLTVGSLCTGTGQLERALTLAGVDTKLAFVADPDPAATTLLAHHHPDVPNLGDITKVDWTRVCSVDIFCAGWPCQPWSLAGKRKGAADERAIWPAVADAVRDLRPRYVFLENVPNVIAAGELARAAGDLAALGYVGSWRCVRASDVGAAHRRERAFILAWQEGDSPTGLGVSAAGTPGGLAGDGAVLTGLLPTPRASDTGTPGRRASEGFRPPLSQVVLPLLKTPTAQLAINGGSQHPDKRKAGGHGPTLADQVEHLLPTPRARDGKGRDANPRGIDLNEAVAQLPAYADRWGSFAPAVRQWEDILGRPAPDPTEPGKTGQRLATRFVEWLMGHEDRYVTSVPGLSRKQQLHLLGNGVVALQGAHALRLLAGGRP